MKRLIATFPPLFLAACVWENTADNPDYLPLDDSEYPYAGIPRIVIETDGFKEIRNNETDIPAKMQIWGDSLPEKEALHITIKGRGYSSFDMPKYSYKIELDTKKNIFGMPTDKDFILLSNFRDKTHLKNYISFALARSLNDYSTPRCQFVELFLNRNYKGLYLFTESIKVSKHRININEKDFLLEKTTNPSDRPFFTTDNKNVFEIRNPKKPTDQDISEVSFFINDFEKKIKKGLSDSLQKALINEESFIRYYWVQEFAKNLDARFLRSIFVIWEKDKPLQMGPLWDFDQAYGEINLDGANGKEWLIKKYGWFLWLWNNPSFASQAKTYWNTQKASFSAILDTIDKTKESIAKAVANDNKRWPVLKNQEIHFHHHDYPNYDNAIDSLKYWIEERIMWINNNI